MPTGGEMNRLAQVARLQAKAWSQRVAIVSNRSLGAPSDATLPISRRLSAKRRRAGAWSRVFNLR